MSETQSGNGEHDSSEDMQQSKIRKLNDEFRQTFEGGRVMMTQGIQALSADIQFKVFAAIQEFDQFNDDVESRWSALPHC